MAEIKNNGNLFWERFFKPLTVLVAIIILAVGYFWILKPLMGDLNTAKAELADVEQQIDNLNQQQENAQIIVDGFTPSEKRLMSLVLPDEFDLPSIIMQLAGLVEANKFVITQVDAEEVKTVMPALDESATAVLADSSALASAETAGPENSKLKRINISLSVAGGDYDALKNLIKLIESSLLIFKVNSIDFSSDKEEYQLNLATYYHAD